MVTELATASLDDLLFKPDSVATLKVKWSLPLVISMAFNIADGMHYLHAKDPAIIHRDLKPANVLVTDKCVCKSKSSP